MRPSLPLLAVTAAVTVSGCSSSGSTGPTRTSASTPAAHYAVPAHAAGEVARDVFDARKGKDFSVSEGVAEPHTSYQLWAACESAGAHASTVRWEVRIALPKRNYLFQSGTLPCDGQAHAFGLVALPPHPIQLVLAWARAAGSGAYGVVAPAR